MALRIGKMCPYCEMRGLKSITINKQEYLIDSNGEIHNCDIGKEIQQALKDINETDKWFEEI